MTWRHRDKTMLERHPFSGLVHSAGRLAWSFFVGKVEVSKWVTDDWDVTSFGCFRFKLYIDSERLAKSFSRSKEIVLIAWHLGLAVVFRVDAAWVLTPWITEHLRRCWFGVTSQTATKSSEATHYHHGCGHDAWQNPQKIIQKIWKYPNCVGH